MAEAGELGAGVQKPGSLEIVHKDSGLLENTVGRLFGLPANLILGTPDAILKDVPVQMTEYLKNKWKDVKWKGNMEVYLNHSPFFHQLKRLYSKDRRINLFLRLLLGTPVTVINSLAGKLGRSNLYNPFTEAAQIFHSNPAVAMHEVGHMKNMSGESPSIRALAYALPVVHSQMEWKASNEAMKRLTGEERDAAKKVLEPAFGTHAGFDLGRIMRYVFPPAAGAYELAGALIGHLHARLFKRNIFYNDASLSDLNKVGIRPAPAVVMAKV